MPLRKLLLNIFAIFILNACGSSESSIDTEESTINFVDILDLKKGYFIDGYNSKDENVYLRYCNNDYEYTRASLNFSGTFVIDNTNTIIGMLDDNGSNYILNTGDGYLEVDQNYDIYNLNYDITIKSFIKIKC